MSFKQDTFNPVSLNIEETAGEVDGKYVLARVAGQFFVPDGKSRNGRFYPRSLWEKAVNDPETQKRISERRMFGTAGHNPDLNDDALRSGILSHVVTKLEIRGDVGYGEALILDTEVGRTLNTLLRAGCKLFVSSRASGEYKGQTEDGLPIVDPETYQLFTFDFVIEPGFLQANPALVENHNQSLSVGVPQMEKLLEQLSKENGSLKNDLERCLKEVETLKNENKTVSEENKHLALKADKNETMGRMLERYKAIGSPEEINKVLERADQLIASFKKYGTDKEIGKALDLAYGTLKNYKQFGEAKEIKLALEKACATIKAYQDFGSIRELKELFVRVEKDQGKIAEARRTLKIAELAKELSVSEESIKMLYGKVSEADIRKLFAASKPVTEKKEGKEDSWRKKNESNKPASKPANGGVFEKSRGARLMEGLSR